MIKPSSSVSTKLLNLLQERGLLALLSFFSVATAFSLFLGLYEIQADSYPYLFFGGASLIILFVGKAWLRLPLLVVAVLVGYHHYYSYNLSFGWTWLQRFFAGIVQSYAQLLSEMNTYVGEVLAIFLILPLCILLLLLFIQYKFLLFGYVIMLGYILMASVFHPNADFTFQALLIAGCGIIAYFMTKYNWRGIRQLKAFVVTGVVIFLFGSAANFFSTGPVRDGLTTATGSIRGELNNLGLYSFINNQGTTLISRTGYSQDDSFLGGPLLDDNTELFTALQQSSHYWRVESKDYYSGAGWFASPNYDYSQFEENDFTIDNPNYQGNYSSEETIEINYLSQDNYFALPYGAKRISLEENPSRIFYEAATEKITVADNYTPLAGTIYWQDFDYDTNDLTTVPTVIPEANEIDYLQLPQRLPKRVRNLAAEITAEVEGQYNQVVAIEEYLKNSSDFRYSKVDAAVLETGQDYVDHFLFESQVGYCDNFSSSMVVMLRTLGIPARWAKGFAPGSRSRVDDNYLYTVTNNNAHSWVEVYFDGFGWLPFEPTPTFNNPDRPTIEDEENNLAESSVAESLASTSSSQQAASSTSSETESSTSELDDEAGTTLENDIHFIMAGFGILLLGVIFILQRYWTMLILWLTLKITRSFEAGYRVVLKYAEKILARPAGETLAAYSQRFAKEFGITPFVELTAMYEVAIYGGGESTEYQLLWQVVKELKNTKK